MEIINLSNEYEKTYCRCLEDWSEEMKEAGDLKEKWLEKKKQEGLRVKLAKNDQGQIVGMIHYVPIEHAPAVGENLYYIYCIWIHGYKEGVGNHQHKGIGKLLLEAAENDCMAIGAKGIVAWGILLPFFMRSKWFKKNGYKKCDRHGMLELVWKPFIDDALPPRFLKSKKKPTKTSNRLTVTCFRSGWCPAQNLSCERMKRAIRGFEDQVDYVEIDTEDRSTLLEWGISDAIFINDKQIVTGPPPSYDKLRKLIVKKVNVHNIGL